MTPSETGLRPKRYPSNVPMTLERLHVWADEDDNGCLIWARALDRRGYGQLRYAKRYWSAHRLAWTLANGPIPADMTVDHLCFTPACINPDHLRLLSRVENSRLQRSTLSETCSRGHQYSRLRSGSRVCVECRNEKARARWARRAP